MSDQPSVLSPRIRVSRAPDWELPFDDERPARVVVGPNALPHPELPLAFVLPSGLLAEPEVPPLTVLPGPRRPYVGIDDDDDGPTFTARADLPDPQAWAGRLAQAVVEVCGGGRPLGQLLRWVSPAVFAQLRDWQPQQPRPVGSRPAGRASSPKNVRVLRHRFDQVRSVHVCEPADGIVEVSVVIAGAQRWWALALRLEGLNGRWVATQLELV